MTYRQNATDVYFLSDTGREAAKRLGMSPARLHCHITKGECDGNVRCFQLSSGGSCHEKNADSKSPCVSSTGPDGGSVRLCGHRRGHEKGAETLQGQEIRSGRAELSKCHQ